MKAFYKIFQKCIYIIALIAIVLTIYTIYDYGKNETVGAQDVGIQSFVIKTLDDSVYIQSTDKMYCRFLYKYTSSFTINGEINEEEILLDEYNGLLEFTTVKGENYSIYIHLSQPVNNTINNRFVGLFQYDTPTLVSVNSVANSNVYVYNSSYSDVLMEIIMELKNL